MEVQKQQHLKSSEEDMISLQDIWSMCVARWRWFLVSLVVVMGVTVIYILKTPPVYTRTAEMLIKEDGKDNSLGSSMDNAFANMGFMKSNTNVNNEIISLKSPALMYEVIKRLKMDIDYTVDGMFHRLVVYGSSLPVNVQFADFVDNEVGCFHIQVGEHDKVVLTDFTKKGEMLDIENPIEGVLNDTLVTPLGRIIVLPTPYYRADSIIKLQVNKKPMFSVVESCAKQLGVNLVSKDATVVSLSFQDICPQRADDVLNTLIAVYNEKWIQDKNQIAVSTSMFINERLKVIERDLGHVDKNISKFKSENLLPDVQAVSNLYLTQSSEINNQILSLNNQLSMAQYIRTYLSDRTHKYQLLPANSGIENSNIENQISDYNTQLLQRNGLVANSSEKNPLVKDMDRALESMRAAVVVSIENQIKTLNTQIASLQQSEKQTTGKIAANPTQAKYLLSVERQQKVKESLYLFLLQKREENELSQAFTSYNTRIITPPSGDVLPTAPEKRQLLMLAFVISMILPISIIFAREFFNTKVRGRKDLQNLTIPFLGEIPLFFNGKKKSFFQKQSHLSDCIVVKAGNRDVINEGFRVLRTNLEFLVKKGEGNNVLVMTSFNPGSGKSFLTMNLAATLAIKNLKVLVIDGDMRHASASNYVGRPKMGLSSFLRGQEESYKKIIVNHPEFANLFVLPVGILPPNPTELLFDNRLSELINQVRNEYDYVFIDCPPIELVADTQIIENFADRTIFVVRAGLLERSMLSELQNIYDEKKYKNLAMVLNGTHGAGHGRYGYRYGYGTSYHYEISED